MFNRELMWHSPPGLSRNGILQLESGQAVLTDWKRDPRAFVAQRLGAGAPLLVIAIAALAAIGLFFASGRMPSSITGERAAEAFSRGVEAGSASFRSLFDRRSPGERQKADLLATKKLRAAQARASSPPSRMFKVLTTAQPPKPLGAPPVDTVALSPTTPPPAAIVGPPGIVDLPPSAPDILPPGAPGILPPPVGTPDVPVLPPPVVTIPEVPIVTPVPEPGTWALMLLGFFGIGIAVRRRNSREGATLVAG